MPLTIEVPSIREWTALNGRKISGIKTRRANRCHFGSCPMKRSKTPGNRKNRPTQTATGYDGVKVLDRLLPQTVGVPSSAYTALLDTNRSPRMVFPSSVASVQNNVLNVSGCSSYY
jgi:hypothetical protein